MTVEPANIGQTIVNGVAFDPKNSERVTAMDLNELFASVGRLFDLLEARGVDYLLVGGIAMRAYVEGRNTQDIDLVVSSAELAKLPELRLEDRNERFAKAWFDTVRVDLLFADAEPFRTVSQRFRTRRDFAGRTVRIATREGLLLLKLFALPSLYRQAQFSKARVYEGDIADLLDTSGEVPAEVWQGLEGTLLQSDIAELERIVDEIRRKGDERRSRFIG